MEMNSIEIIPGLFITRHKCALIDDSLIISDLHIGYESVLEDTGIHLPRIQTMKISEMLLELLERFEPSRIIVLGDFKHEFSRNLNQEWADIRHLLKLMTEWADVLLIKGNHDNYLANITSRLDIPLVESFSLNGISLIHGHHSSSSRPLVMGHEHPSIRLFDPVGASISLPCFLHDPHDKLTVMPAFSPLATGTDVSVAEKDDFLSPILRIKKTDSMEVYACSEVGLLYLGTISQLRDFKNVG